MRVKLFTLRYSATLGGFDDTALTEFTRERELVSFREHFFSVNDVPHLACVMVWQDAVVAIEDVAAARDLPRPPPRKDKGRTSSTRSSTESVLEGLDERERVLFNTLREWRSKKAHEEGVPPYLVFTNRHLVELVRRRPDSPTALTNISGIGPGKVTRYGKEMLSLLGARTEDVRQVDNGAAETAPETTAVAASEASP